MRTQQEIQRQVDGLKKEQDNLRNSYAPFASATIERVQMQIDIITGENHFIDEKLSDDDEFDQAAYEAKLWLDGEMNEDLF